MKLFDSKYFRIYYQNETLETLKDIENTLNNAYDLVFKYFNIKIEKTNVYVFCDQVEFQRQRNPAINENNKIDWWVGETMDKDILVVSPTLNLNSHNYQSILGVISHEFIHTVINQINKNCNIWINEGVALYLTNGNKSKDILKNNKIPNIEIFKVNDQNQFAKEGGYIFADKFIEYVSKNYENGKILELIKNNNYEKILEKGLKEIYNEWINYITENYK
jgi:hypothetical protein